MADALPIKPEATIAAPDVGWLASDGTMLWVFTGAGQVARLDPATNVLGQLATVDPTHLDGGFAVSQRGLWLNDFDANLVYRVDPVSLKVVAKIASAHNPEGLAVDPRNGAVWVANHRGGTVTRIVRRRTRSSRRFQLATWARVVPIRSAWDSAASGSACPMRPTSIGSIR